MKLNPNLDVFSNDLPCWERGQEGGRSRPMDRDILFKNLVEIHEVLWKNGIDHWLSHGTCLGAIRENNFIEWDDDADIGLYFKDREKIKPVIRELERRGFYVPPSDPTKPVSKENAPYYDLVAIKDGEKVEGWFFEKKGDFYIYDYPRCGNDLKHPAEYYDRLDSYDFRGVQFNIPGNIVAWLEMMYGDTWYIPNKNKKYNNQK